MQAVSILGQAKPMFSLTLAKQDARRMVLDSLLTWINEEYFAGHSPIKYGVVTQSPQLTKRSLEFLASMVCKLGKEQWSIEENEFEYGIRYRCYVVVTLEAWDMEHMVSSFSQFSAASGQCRSGGHRQLQVG